MRADDVTVLDPRAGRRVEPYPADLDAWQRLVQGPIEIVATKARDVLLVVNEEGWLNGLPFNQWASVIAGRFIVGPVVVVDGGAFKRWQREERGNR